MDGYDDTTYGDAFADVYDDWYADVSDIDETVATLLELADGTRVMELGVGTGRLALPLARAGAHLGVAVTGIDTSPSMLERLSAQDPDGLVTGLHGDMAAPLAGAPYDLVFAAYNTLFNLTDSALQRRCFTTVADALRPGGAFVVEAFVPPLTGLRSSDVSVKALAADRVVLSVSVEDPERQVAEGQFVEFSETGGVRLRPWSIRYASPAELDAMAQSAGFEVEHRWHSFARDSFVDDSDRHVTVYRLP